MPTINTPGSAHVAPAPNSGFQWLAYADDNKLKKALQDAFFIIQNNIRGMRPCNKCFKALPGGKSFDDVWDDAAVFVSFDPQGKGGTFGATLGKDITITAFSLRMGRWTTAATLVHELAHVNGAPGTDRQGRSRRRLTAIRRQRWRTPPWQTASVLSRLLPSGATSTSDTLTRTWGSGEPRSEHCSRSV